VTAASQKHVPDWGAQLNPPTRHRINSPFALCRARSCAVAVVGGRSPAHGGGWAVGDRPARIPQAIAL